MVKPEDILRVAQERGKKIPDVALDRINNELSKINQATIQAEEEAKFVYEIWDKVSPINGVPAEKFLTRDDVDPDSEIYLIKDAATGQVIYFQPHEPESAGFVRMKTKADAENVAKAHKTKIAEMRANVRVAEQVLSKF